MNAARMVAAAMAHLVIPNSDTSMYTVILKRAVSVPWSNAQGRYFFEINPNSEPKRASYPHWRGLYEDRGP